MRKKVKLVMSGSGTLYPIHAGAAKALVETGHEIEQICGVSGGAIVGGAIASGYKPGRMLDELILDTLPGPNGLIDWAWWPFRKKGLIKGEKIENEFRGRLVSTLGDTKIPLALGVADLNQKKHYLPNSKTNPEISLAKTIRASMCIPGVFQQVKIGGHYYVDGGIVANFPLDAFGTGEDVIGFRIMPQAQHKTEVNGLLDYFKATVQTMLHAASQEHVEDAVFARTIPLEIDESILDLNMSREKAKELIEFGYQTTLKRLGDYE